MNDMEKIVKRFDKLLELTGWSCYKNPIATYDQLVEFENNNSLCFPEQLKDYLKEINGLDIDGGAIISFGVFQERSYLDIVNCLDENKAYMWKEKGWIPISCDCCGNYYVIDTRCKNKRLFPVYFLDHEQSLTETSYVVASSVYNCFKHLLLEKIYLYQAKDIESVFDKDYYLREDPDIVLLDNLLLPWEA